MYGKQVTTEQTNLPVAVTEQTAQTPPDTDNYDDDDPDNNDTFDDDLPDVHDVGGDNDDEIADPHSDDDVADNFEPAKLSQQLSHSNVTAATLIRKGLREQRKKTVRNLEEFALGRWRMTVTSHKNVIKVLQRKIESKNIADAAAREKKKLADAKKKAKKEEKEAQQVVPVVPAPIVTTPVAAPSP